VSGAASEPFADAAARGRAAELGIWVFLATELMFFGPLLAAYLQLRVLYPEAFAAASRHTLFWAGTANTFVLLTSSLAVALGGECLRRAPRRAARWFAVAGALGLVFLGVKFFEYFVEWRGQLVPGAGFVFEAAHRHGAELFYYLYFAFTGVHALHLCVGIGLVAVVAWRLAHGAARFEAFAEGVARYWHLVDIVWVFLYPLLYLIGRYS
jgi:cytochrome c oxidase subunit 3